MIITDNLKLVFLRNRAVHKSRVMYLPAFSFFYIIRFTPYWYSLNTVAAWLLKTFKDLFFYLYFYKSAFLLLAFVTFYFYLSIDFILVVSKSILSLIMLWGEKFPFFKLRSTSSFYLSMICFELFISVILFILRNLTEEVLWRLCTLLLLFST